MKLKTLIYEDNLGIQDTVTLRLTIAYRRPDRLSHSIRRYAMFNRFYLWQQSSRYRIAAKSMAKSRKGNGYVG